MPESPPASRNFLRFLIGRVLLIAALAASAVFLYQCHDRAQSRRRAILDAFYNRHGGKVAWINSRDRIGWIDAAPGAPEHHFDPGTKPVRVAWSSSGDRLFAVLESGTFDSVHRIVSINLADGTSRTLLDLALTPLEDNDIDEDEFWVAPFGDAESEVDRVYFKVGKKNWYSVEGKRARVRPEAGPPTARWDQSRSPDGALKIEEASDDDDSWLVVTDGHVKVKLTSDDPEGPAAWWCAH